MWLHILDCLFPFQAAVSPFQQNQSPGRKEEDAYLVEAQETLQWYTCLQTSQGQRESDCQIELLRAQLTMSKLVQTIQCFFTWHTK